MIAMEMFGISWEDVWQRILDFAGIVWESLTAGTTANIKGWVQRFNTFKSILIGIWTAISGVFVTAWTNITTGVSAAVGFIVGVFTSFRDTILGIWNTIWNGIKFVINSITGGINVMIRGLNNLRIDIPEWVPFMVGQTFGISIPEIPQLAEGGIVTEPTIAMIGEAGPEAVVPLDGSNNIGGGISITIENLSVRNDQDVKLIAQELATMIDRKNRGRGVTY